MRPNDDFDNEPDLESLTCNERVEWIKGKEKRDRERRLDRAIALAKIDNDDMWADAFWNLPHPKGGTVGEQSWKAYWDSLPWWRKLAWKLWGKRTWDAKKGRRHE